MDPSPSRKDAGPSRVALVCRGRQACSTRPRRRQCRPPRNVQGKETLLWRHGATGDQKGFRHVEPEHCSGWQASPHADPHRRQPHPSPLVCHDILYFFPSPRSQAALFSFSIGWRRTCFEDALGEDQKGFCVIGGCDGSVVGLPLLFDFPFPVSAARSAASGTAACPSPCRDGGGEGGGMPREGRVSDAVGM